MSRIERSARPQMFQAAGPDERTKGPQRAEAGIWRIACRDGRWAALLGCILLSVVFFKAQAIGGMTYDEHLDRVAVHGQLYQVIQWFAGDEGAHYSRVPSDLAYYGIVHILPAFIAEKSAIIMGQEDPLHTYSLTLHVIAFLAYLATLFFTYRILMLVTRERSTAFLGAVLLASFPLWLGYGFFDYKDMPTAALALMALYAAVGLLDARAEQMSEVRWFAGLLVVATVLSAGIKLAAVGLLLPAWVAAAYVLFQRGRPATLAFAVSMTVGGVLIVTPMSWFDPLQFAAAAVRHMADHPWAKCTMTFGECMGPQAADWSAGRYLAAWFLAQMPVLVGLGAIGGLVLAVRRGPGALTVAASVIFPVTMILALNSTLYSGLRQLLFLMPMVFILSVIFWRAAAEYLGRITVLILCFGQIIIFGWDNVRLFPYNYVYFNLITRQVADTGNFEADFWGFSLREALSLPVVSSDGIVIGEPAHLVAPFVPKGREVVSLAKAEALPGGTEAVLVSRVLSRAEPHALPQGCSESLYVTRQLPLGGRPLDLSVAARCVIGAGIGAGGRSASRGHAQSPDPMAHPEHNAGFRPRAWPPLSRGTTRPPAPAARKITVAPLGRIG